MSIFDRLTTVNSLFVASVLSTMASAGMDAIGESRLSIGFGYGALAFISMAITRHLDEMRREED